MGGLPQPRCDATPYQIMTGWSQPLLPDRSSRRSGFKLRTLQTLRHDCAHRLQFLRYKGHAGPIYPIRTSGHRLAELQCPFSPIDDISLG